MPQFLPGRLVDKRALIAFGWLALAASVLSGQQQSPAAAAPVAVQSTPPAPPVYEVASVKKFKPDGGPMTVSMRFDPDGLTATHIEVKSLICMAYGVSDYQVSGGPAWVESDQYDVRAKMDESTSNMLRDLTTEQRKLAREQMAQALLADRFKLTVHHETKQLPVYALVVAKGGPKLHESKSGDDYPNGIQGPDAKAGGKGMMRMEFDSGGMLMTAQAMSMDSLVRQLEGQVHSKVENETGLKGDYDFTLRFSIDEARVEVPNPSGGSANVSLADNSGTTIFTALQEQLGLKLESKKAPVDVIVIDHIEAPSEN
jgi:uncharacterized protein (TIGR03435 family)